MPPKYPNPYFLMPDGTLKHIHPLSGTEVWTVPSRANRPLPNQNERPPQPLIPAKVEDYCDFCRENYLRTPPEKARLVLNSGGSYQKLDHLLPGQLESSHPLFRRLPNLFEIITFDYWAKNHGFQLNPSQSQWKKTYLGHPKGLEHVLKLIDTKLKLSGRTPEEIRKMPENGKLAMADGFFGGTHEVIVAGRHFQEGAKWDNELFSPGAMSPEEYFQFMRFTVGALADIYSNNPLVRYVVVYQNWLKPAGASFDHLHKQLVGLDEWGPDIQNQLDLARENPRIFNEALVDFVARHQLVVAENDHAVALSEMGHRYPTLGVYSKSANTRPQDHGAGELRGFSDLLHACHAGLGGQIPCNEEWYYAPPGTDTAMPWYVLVKARTTTSAGFEGSTRIFINPVSPAALRDQVVPRLKDLRAQGKIGDIQVGAECGLKPNALRYGEK